MATQDIVDWLVCDWCGLWMPPHQGSTVHPACERAMLLDHDHDAWTFKDAASCAARNELFRTLHEDRTLPGQGAE